MEKNNIGKIIIIILLIIILIAIILYIFQEETEQMEEIPAQTEEQTEEQTEQQTETTTQQQTETTTQQQTETTTQQQTETQNICIERTPGEWKYINEMCDPSNNTTLITNKSRQILIKKINNDNECSFEPLVNETIFETDIDKGFLNSNQKIQFKPNVLRLNTVQTEKINEPNHLKCKCDNPDLSENMYTVWSNWDKTCPDPSDYNKSATDLSIFQTRTRRYKPNSDKLEGSACIFSEKIGIKCPRNCKGPDPSLNTSYTEWDETNWNKTCPDPSNNILPESDYKITRTRTRTYNSEIKELYGGKCLDTPATKEIVKIDCSRNCFGGDWNYSVCTAELCKNGNIETRELIPGTRTKSWKGGTEAINGGKICAEMHPPELEDCSRKCNIDCEGSWSACSPACGPGEQTYNISKEKKNNGNDCKDVNGIRTKSDKLVCYTPCPQHNCIPNWSLCTNVNGIDYQQNTLTPAGPGGSCPASPANGEYISCGAAKENDNVMFIRYPRDDGSNENWKVSTTGWKNMQTLGGWNQDGSGSPAKGWALVMHDNIRVDDNRFRYKWDSNGNIRPDSRLNKSELCLGLRYENGYQTNKIEWRDDGECLQFGWNGSIIQVKNPRSTMHNHCLESDGAGNNSQMIIRSCSQSGNTLKY